MNKRCLNSVFALLISTASVAPLAAGISMTVTTSRRSPAFVGERVKLEAFVSGAGEDVVWYRYRVRRMGEEPSTIVDFGPFSYLEWTAAEREGLYEIEVTALHKRTGESVASIVPFQMQSRVKGDEPVLNSTGNPLVFLYSAPPCSSGGRMRVEFAGPEGLTQSTPSKVCQPGTSMNFYLAGLRKSTEYTVQHVVETASDFEQGPVLKLEMPDVEVQLPAVTAGVGDPKRLTEQTLLHGPINSTVFATDLEGNLVWYYPEYISQLTRPVSGGSFIGIIQDPVRDESYQTVREFDLAGITVQETNAARINEQLEAMGKRTIGSFHHEAARLKDGKLLVLASVEEILTDVQGPGPVNVVGDAIVVLDRDLKVVWAWDGFEYFHPSEPAVLGEKCQPVACAPLFKAPVANDWMHSNSVQESPDGNLVVSIRHFDWVVKIDYNNGRGGGGILWRLGKHGDFQIDSTDPYPWFSHQHDAAYPSDDPSVLLVFDNGNTRRQEDPEARSRGQLIQLDETNRTAKLLLNADLGGYAGALGSAQKLSNGNYHFDVGFLPGQTAVALEVDPEGNPVFSLQTSTYIYRSFRMRNVYNVR